MNKPHKHAGLLMQYAQDAAKVSEPWLLYEITVYGGDGVWRALMKDAVFLEIGGCIRRKPNADELLADMLKPKLKPVDMSVLVGIDCSFHNAPDDEQVEFSQLVGIGPDGSYDEFETDTYVYCKPRMNYWFSLLNFDDKFLLQKLGDAGFETKTHPSHSFKITGLKNGYCWPWELEE